MASPVEQRIPVGSDKKRQKNEDYICITHISSVDKERTQPLTVVRWKKLVVCARKWLEIDGIDRTLAEAVCVHDDEFAKNNNDDDSTSTLACPDESLPGFLEVHKLGFHPTCYRRFIDKKRIASAEKLAEKRGACGGDNNGSDSDHESSTTTSTTSRPPSPKRLRSTTKSSRSGNVLPAICIICKRVDRFVKEGHKTKKDKLVQAETINAGSLVKAAELKMDESILKDVRGKDCVAIEVRYHKRCYKEYTRFLVATTSDERMPKAWEYATVYTEFCDKIIQAQLIKKQEIFRMKKLSSLFQKMIREHHGHGSYRSDLLKKRLRSYRTSQQGFIN
ncbi:uncharacterized protein V3H82_010671 isoform 1-T1 [Fundulus diaphanus]